MPETTHPPAPPATSQPNPVKHFVYGLIPAAIGAIAILWHLLNPFMPPAYQGLLFAIATFCGNITLAVWLWCAVQVVRRQFTERDRRADERVQRIQQEFYVTAEVLSDRHNELIARIDKLARSVGGLHQHNARTDGQVQQMADEIAHNRNLILGLDTDIPAQQRGPRRLN